MKRILFIHPEGNINDNPNLTGIVEILCEREYAVEIASPCRPGILQKPPCSGATLRLIDVPNFGYVYNYGFIVPVELIPKPDTLRTYLKQTFGEMDLVIGVDRGIIEAFIIAQFLNIPFGLISYEIYFSGETGKEFKAPEIAACRRVSFAVCQDRVRSAHLSRENEIPLEKIIDIPLAGRSVKWGGCTYTLHDLLNLEKNKKIALYIGHVNAKWTAIDELLKSTYNWNDEWVLILHHRYGTHNLNMLNEKLNKKSTKNVFVSPFPQLPFERMGTLLHASDLGIAFYVPQGQKGSFLDCNNLAYLGMSSGKISTCIQHGLPIMTNEIGEMSGYVKQYGLGVVAKDFQEIPLLLKDITKEKLSDYKENCYRFFEKKLDLNLTIKPLLSTIELLCERTQERYKEAEARCNETLSIEGVLSQVRSHAILGLGNLHSSKGDYKLAEEEFNEFLSMKEIPDSSKVLAHYNFGSMYERKGDYAKAKDKFETVLALAKDSNVVGNAHFHLGCIYQALGEAEKARREFEDCLKLIPDHKKARKKRVELLD